MRDATIDVETTEHDSGLAPGFRLTIACSAATEMPTAIFRYRSLSPSAPDGSRRSAFDGVCSPSDLEDHPQDAPEPESGPGWFRLAVVDLVFRSRAEVDETRSAILAEIDALIKTLNRLDAQGDSLSVVLDGSGTI